MLCDYSLKTNDPVVYFEQGKSMMVNYNPRLKTLIDEVHQLQLLGFKIPPAIAETARKADLFVKQAKALEQVCHIFFTCKIINAFFIGSYCK